MSAGPDTDAARFDDPQSAGQFVFEASLAALKGGTDVDSCTVLLTRINRGIDATLEQLRRRGAPIACKSGCSFCCHLRVTVTPLEAIALFRYLKAQIPAALAAQIEARILANADEIARMSEAEHWGRNLKCAFLVDGACSAYRARPLACALHHSLDVDACERSYHDPSDHSVGIRKLEALERSRPATHKGLSRALGQLGLSDEPAELHGAVAAIVRNPSLIARWRSGRPLVRTKPKA